MTPPSNSPAEFKCPAGLSTEQAQYMQRSGLERHLQTGLTACLVAICGWMAFTIHNSSIKIAELTVQVGSLQNQVASLQMQARNAYTDDDASRDLDPVNQQLNDLRVRVRDLEMRRSEDDR